VKPTPVRTRQLMVEQGKRVANAARSRHNLKFEAIASAIDLRLSCTKRKFSVDSREQQLTYGDLFMLAKDPETAAMVREMLAPILAITDPQNLRLVDIEAMCRSVTGASTVLAFLRPTIDAVMPLMNVTTTEAE